MVFSIIAIPIFTDSESNLLSDGTLKVCDMTCSLPVDEDDYLMPSPGPRGQPQNYIDVVGDASKLPGKIIIMFFSC